MVEDEPLVNDENEEVEDEPLVNEEDVAEEEVEDEPLVNDENEEDDKENENKLNKTESNNKEQIVKEIDLNSDVPVIIQEDEHKEHIIKIY